MNRFAKSIANRRRGAKAWQTRKNNLKAVGEALEQNARREIEKREFGGRDVEIVAGTTAGWLIERQWSGQAMTLDFDAFYREIKDWAEHPDYRARVRETAFGVIKGFSLSSALMDMLAAKTTIVTPRAEYRLRCL